MRYFAYILSLLSDRPIFAETWPYRSYLYIYINSYSIFHTFLLFTQLSSVEIYYRIKTIHTHIAT
jgi:hypothetical protein